MGRDDVAIVLLPRNRFLTDMPCCFVAVIVVVIDYDDTEMGLGKVRGACGSSPNASPKTSNPLCFVLLVTTDAPNHFVSLPIEGKVESKRTQPHYLSPQCLVFLVPRS